MNTYNYEINEDGSIISKHTGNQIYVATCKKGYSRVRLKHADGGKPHLVHRLIALKFIPNPDNLPQVNHKDGNKSNNRADNLEWVTNKRNCEHAVANGLYHVTRKACEDN